MKKFIMCFSFVLVCILTFALFTSQSILGEKEVRAKSLLDEKMLIVVGYGEVEVMPDTIQINFGLKTRSETLLDGQTKMKESIDNISSKLKEFDENSTVYITYSSSYPISEGGMLMYEFDCNLVVKSTRVDNSNDLIDVLINSGATSVHHASYSLTNKEDSYVQALVKAKDNANKKVEAMYSNAVFKGLKEESVFNYCENSRGEKIKVIAKVKAFYELEDLENNSQNVNSENKVSEPVATNLNNKNIKNNNLNNKVVEEQNKTNNKENIQNLNKNLTNKQVEDNANSTDKKLENKENLDNLNSTNTIVTADNTIVRIDSAMNENEIATLEEKDAV